MKKPEARSRLASGGETGKVRRNILSTVVWSQLLLRVSEGRALAGSPGSLFLWSSVSWRGACWAVGLESEAECHLCRTDCAPFPCVCWATSPRPGAGPPAPTPPGCRMTESNQIWLGKVPPSLELLPRCPGAVSAGVACAHVHRSRGRWELYSFSLCTDCLI